MGNNGLLSQPFLKNGVKPKLQAFDREEKKSLIRKSLEGGLMGSNGFIKEASNTTVSQRHLGSLRPLMSAPVLTSVRSSRNSLDLEILHIYALASFQHHNF